MNIKDLQNFTKFVIAAQKPAAPGEFVLYVAEKQICIDRNAPRTANHEIICTINADYINSGLPHPFWWAICSKIWRLKKKGAL